MNELIIDNFAGGGGASVGIEKGLGRPVDIAINHDAVAIAMHKANHPETEHLNENVWDVDPVEICKGRPVGLAWFSPDCTHFSKAKGGKPVKKKIRGLAWVVLKYAAKVKPRVIMLENVEEFVTWGPLVRKENGDHHPCPKRKGQTFKTFIKALEKYGYTVEYKTLRACDYGAPTIRKRLFMIARSDGQPIIWPEPTHADPKSEEVRSGKLKPWRTAAECIDFDVPTHSIFLTKEEAKKVRVKRPLAEATMRRIARGLQKYVIETADPFIVTYYGEKGNEFRGQDLKTPLRTQTTENRHGLITPFIARTDMHKSNARCAYNIKDALRTITSSGGHAVVIPFLSSCAYSKTTGRGKYIYSPKDLLRTLTSTNDKLLVSPTLIQTGYGERKGQAPRAPGLHKPLGTAMAGGTKHALVSAFLAKHYTGVVRSSLKAPKGTVTSIDHDSLVAVNMIKHMGQSVGSDPKEPTRTVTGKEKDGVVTSHMVKLRGTNIGHDARGPLHTITASGTHLGEVRAFLMKYYGTEQDPQLKEPLHTVTTKDRFGLVTVQGQEYQIVDIGMRMLTPRELFRAQGFPDSYIIDKGHYPGELLEGKPITKTQQVAKCGNSVCPPLAEALVKANMSDTRTKQKEQVG